MLAFGYEAVGSMSIVIVATTCPFDPRLIVQEVLTLEGRHRKSHVRLPRETAGRDLTSSRSGRPRAQRRFLARRSGSGLAVAGWTVAH